MAQQTRHQRADSTSSTPFPLSPSRIPKPLVQISTNIPSRSGNKLTHVTKSWKQETQRHQTFDSGFGDRSAAIERYQQRAASTERELARLRAENVKSELSFSALRIRLENEKSELQRQLDSTARQLTAVQVDKAQLERDVASLRTSFEKKVSEHEQQLAEERNQRISFKDRANNLGFQLLAVSGEVQTLSQDIVLAEERGRKAGYEQFANERTDLEALASQARQNAESLEKQLVEERAGKAELETKLEELKAHYEETQNEREQAYKAKTEAENALKEALDEQGRLERENNDLRAAITERTTNKNTILDQIRKSKEEVLEQLSKAQQGLLDSMMMEHNSASTNLNEHYQQLEDDHRQRYEELRNQFSGLANSIAELKRELDESNRNDDPNLAVELERTLTARYDQLQELLTTSSHSIQETQEQLRSKVEEAMKARQPCGASKPVVSQHVLEEVLPVAGGASSGARKGQVKSCIIWNRRSGKVRVCVCPQS
jgi:chromosome segregation ATPase